MSGENRGWRAHVEQDFAARGVLIRLALDTGTGRIVYEFTPPTRRHVDPEEYGIRTPDAPLGIEADAARALYEALAEHFGHTGHDMRALRKDYEHERGRVDRLIGFVTGETRR